MYRFRSRSAFTLLEALIVSAAVGVLLGILVPAVLTVRSTAMKAKCANNLRQIGLGLCQFHDAHSALPPGVGHPRLLGWSNLYGPDADSYPLLSWLGRILPYVDQEALWDLTTQAYALDAIYINDPPHVGLTTPVALFVCPSDPDRQAPSVGSLGPPAPTSYLGVSGLNGYENDGTLFFDSQVRFTDVTDGTSCTLMVGERPPPPGLVYGRWYGGWGLWGTANSYLGVCETQTNSANDGCPLGPYQFGQGQVQDPCAAYHFWSMHSGGGNFLFVDGSVHFLSYQAAPLMPELASRAGGEDITSAF